ncbi:MAG: hypothetical protein ACLUI3_08195 [Christensenellales bacterium]
MDAENRIVCPTSNHVLMLRATDEAGNVLPEFEKVLDIDVKAAAGPRWAKRWSRISCPWSLTTKETLVRHRHSASIRARSGRGRLHRPRGHRGHPAQRTGRSRRRGLRP